MSSSTDPRPDALSQGGSEKAERRGLAKIEHTLQCAIFAEEQEHWADVRRLILEGVSEERASARAEALAEATKRAERAWQDTLDDCRDLRQAGMNAIEAIEHPFPALSGPETNERKSDELAEGDLRVL